MKQELRLYNVLFPVWMLIFFPQVWLAVLPGNFLVDTAVLLLALAYWKVGERRQVWKTSILRVWLLGFLCDLAGAALIVGVFFLWERLWPQAPLFSSLWEQAMALPGILLAGVLIYRLNRKFSFRRCGLPPETVHRLSLALAVFTAPYTMLIPVSWLYY